MRATGRTRMCDGVHNNSLMEQHKYMTIYKYVIAHNVPLYRMGKNGQIESTTHNKIIDIGQKLTKKSPSNS